MNILVTGATGFIGSNLVRVLIENGHQVRALVRKSSQLNELKEMDVEITEADLGDKHSLAKAVAGIEVVFHLAGQLGKFGLPDEVYFQTHVLGTKNLLEVCRNLPNFKQFIFCSTIGVLGPSQKKPLAETAKYNPTNIYEQTKARAEQLVLTAIKEGFPATIIRPNFVYGPCSLHVLQMFKAIQNKRFFLIGQAKNLIQPIYIKDLIDGFLLVLNNPRAISQIYHLAGEESVELSSFFQLIAHNLNVEMPKLKIPIWFAVLALYPLILLAKIFHSQPILTKSRLRFFIDSRACMIDKAKKELGYQPKFSLEEGIRLSTKAYRQKGYLK